MKTKTLYKYRPLDNWKFILDILINNRLHASPFHSLNDPMEGRYFYYDRSVSEGFRRAIYEGKVQYNICSLSLTKQNTLLWSYYAGGHKGVAFGVRVLQKRNLRSETRNVTYDNGVYVGGGVKRRDPTEVALEILTQKQMAWDHEKEVRVFVEGSFVSVELVEMVLGCKIEPGDEELLKRIALQLHPNLRIKKMKTSDLDKPEAI